MFGWPLGSNNLEDNRTNDNYAMTRAASKYFHGKIAIVHQYSTICPFGTDIPEFYPDFNKTRPSYADDLENIWENGYVPVMNLAFTNCTRNSGSRAMVRTIAIGHFTHYLEDHADYVVTFLSGKDGIAGNEDDRRIYIAPMWEMNGNHFPWANQSPSTFKKAWNIVVQTFRNAVRRNPKLGGGNYRNVLQVIFCALNADLAKPRVMERYYPGNAFVDFVALDAYNFGAAIGSVWKSPEEVFNHEHMLKRLLKVSNHKKPLAVLETATGTYDIQTSKTGKKTLVRSFHLKEKWLTEAFTYLHRHNFKMVLYQNLNIQLKASKKNQKEHDWPVFNFMDDGAMQMITGDGLHYWVNRAFRDAMDNGRWVVPDRNVRGYIEDWVFRGKNHA